MFVLFYVIVSIWGLECTYSLEPSTEFFNDRLLKQTKVFDLKCRHLSKTVSVFTLAQSNNTNKICRLFTNYQIPVYLIKFLVKNSFGDTSMPIISAKVGIQIWDNSKTLKAQFSHVCHWITHYETSLSSFILSTYFRMWNYKRYQKSVSYSNYFHAILITRNGAIIKWNISTTVFEIKIHQWLLNLYGFIMDCCYKFLTPLPALWNAIL